MPRSRPASRARKPADGWRRSVPMRCRISPCILCVGRWQVLGAGSLDARGGDRTRDYPRQVYRGRDYHASAGLQCRARILPGRTRAQATLTALKSRLSLNAFVRRDNVWATVPAALLVPGDLVKLSLGAVVAADVCLSEGSVLLDQSMLTGESVPAEAGAGFETFAGALVRRGEAVAEVTATGARTKFGRTAELLVPPTSKVLNRRPLCARLSSRSCIRWAFVR